MAKRRKVDILQDQEKLPLDEDNELLKIILTKAVLMQMYSDDTAKRKSDESIFRNLASVTFLWWSSMKEYNLKNKFRRISKETRIESVTDDLKPNGDHQSWQSSTSRRSQAPTLWLNICPKAKRCEMTTFQYQENPLVNENSAFDLLSEELLDMVLSKAVLFQMYPKHTAKRQGDTSIVCGLASVAFRWFGSLKARYLKNKIRHFSKGIPCFVILE